jgi:hypothetical protein
MQSELHEWIVGIELRRMACNEVASLCDFGDEILVAIKSRNF